MTLGMEDNSNRCVGIKNCLEFSSGDDVNSVTRGLGSTILGHPCYNDRALSVKYYPSIPVPSYF